MLKISMLVSVIALAVGGANAIRRAIDRLSTPSRSAIDMPATSPHMVAAGNNDAHSKVSPELILAPSGNSKT
jgi:hypothetical protein